MLWLLCDGGDGAGTEFGCLIAPMAQIDELPTHCCCLCFCVCRLSRWQHRRPPPPLPPSWPSRCSPSGCKSQKLRGPTLGMRSVQRLQGWRQQVCGGMGGGRGRDVVLVCNSRCGACGPCKAGGGWSGGGWEEGAECSCVARQEKSVVPSGFLFLSLVQSPLPSPPWWPAAMQSLGGHRLSPLLPPRCAESSAIASKAACNDAVDACAEARGRLDSERRRASALEAEKAAADERLAAALAREQVRVHRRPSG